jgi:hypothetical protein
MLDKTQNDGYPVQDARAKVCQDIVLKAIAESSMSRNVTIKGGVVMRSITGNVRRATQDMDIDFIRYSLSDEAIDIFIQKINCLPDITIERIGKITELNQQDYHGKSVKILITDEDGVSIESKRTCCKIYNLYHPLHLLISGRGRTLRSSGKKIELMNKK